MITYEDSTGSTHTIRHTTAWPLTRLRVGDAVEIIYLARRPEKGIVNSSIELFFPPRYSACT